MDFYKRYAKSTTFYLYLKYKRRFLDKLTLAAIF